MEKKNKSKQKMAPKRRKCAPAYKYKICGRFLIYLYDKYRPEPTENWLFAKKVVRQEFKEFMELPQNADIATFCKGARREDIGSLLNTTQYLVETENGSNHFCINNQKFIRFCATESARIALEEKFTVAVNTPHRMPNRDFFNKINALPNYLPPLEMVQAKNKKFSDEALCELCPDFTKYLNNQCILSESNFQTALRTILQVEDMEIIEKYYQLIQRDVKLSVISEFNFKLRIQSRNRGKFRCANESLLSPYNSLLLVQENAITKSLKKDFFREFLLKGSNEFTVPDKEIGPTYRGQVDAIDIGDVYFTTKIKLPNPEASFLIIFLPSRITLRYQYSALELLAEFSPENLRRFFFPPKITKTIVLSNMTLNLYNPVIAANPEQLCAVKEIVCRPQLAPFIIFGPPGTGKTSIIVEAILQLLKRQPKAKVLITASPNSACDEIGLRLCQALSLENKPRAYMLARVYCWSQERRRDNIDPLLREYSNMYEWQFMPNVDVLHKYQIVVCTLTAIGKLATGGFGYTGTDGCSVFTHIFLDEAAASTEPEVLAGLTSTLNTKTQLIIAGDHQQLGPILNSKRAEALGLGVSLMERLLARDCYHVDETGDYNKCIQTRLCRNFRSHPAIVKLFSRLYYDDKLITAASEETVTFCRNWSQLPNPDYPIIFHSVEGDDVFEDEMGSFYNLEELNEVMSYVDDLIYNGIDGRTITEDDIGIIAPYRSQYQMIQDRLNARHLYHIETGSVETYRGKEKSIIIASLVRSKRKGLGFLKSSKRINVILSRAKSLLILIGNANKLKEFPDYVQIIDECQKNKTFKGVPLEHETKQAPQKVVKQTNIH